MPNFDLPTLILRIAAAFFALVIHESVKARCSTVLGDPFPKNNGLLSGNPIKYIEPVGFLLTVIFGFGWGRPTPTAPMYYKDVKKGIFITYLTPSLVNFLVGLTVALILGILYALVPQAPPGALPAMETAGLLSAWAVHWIFRFMLIFSMVNISIALFNMIPVPPLDAAKLLQSVLSPNAAVKFSQNEKVLQIVLMLLIVIGIVGQVINPVSQLIVRSAMAL